MPAQRMPFNARSGDLAKIHIAKKQLGMDDSTYRALLWTIGRVTSSADLDHAGRARLLDHFRACGWQPAPPKQKAPASDWEWVNRAAPDKKPMLRKVKMILDEAKRAKAYVDAIAQEMFGVDLVEFCRPDQLHGIVVALSKDQTRRKSKAAQ